MAVFTKLAFDEMEPVNSLERSREFLEAMRGRRSVRHFSSRPVPLEIIQNCVRAACTAPSGANQQPWHFAIVSDAMQKARIREGAEKEEREFYEGGRAPAEWLQKLEQFGTDANKSYLETVPFVVVLFAQSYGLTEDGAKEKHYYVSESVGIAAGIFITAIHNAGLATLTHTPSPMGFLAELLERPKNERPYLLLPVGYPAVDAVVPVISKKGDDEVMSLV